MANRDEGAGQGSAESPDKCDEYERILDARMLALGEEMRPRAELIIGLAEDIQKMKKGHERFRLEKVLFNLERQFVDDFNRDDAFERFQWPDGLVVEFVAPSTVTSKRRVGDAVEQVHRLQAPERVVAAPSPSASEDVTNLQVVRGRRPVFTRSSR